MQVDSFLYGREKYIDSHVIRVVFYSINHSNHGLILCKKRAALIIALRIFFLFLELFVIAVATLILKLRLNYLIRPRTIVIILKKTWKIKYRISNNCALKVSGYEGY